MHGPSDKVIELFGDGGHGWNQLLRQNNVVIWMAKTAAVNVL
jgi:hypothetical protein